MVNAVKRRRQNRRGCDKYARCAKESDLTNHKKRVVRATAQASVDKEVQRLKKRNVTNPTAVANAKQALKLKMLELEKPGPKYFSSPHNNRARGQKLAQTKQAAKVDVDMEHCCSPRPRPLTGAERNKRYKEKKRQAKIEAAQQDVGKLLQLRKHLKYSSYEDARVDDRFDLHFQGRERTEKGKGGREEQSLAAWREACEQAGQGVIPLCAITGVRSVRGFRKSVKTSIENIIDVSVTAFKKNKRLLSKWLDKREQNRLVLCLTMAADGLPGLGDQSLFQVTAQVHGGACSDDSSDSESYDNNCKLRPTDLCRTVGIAKADEGAEESIALLREISKELAELEGRDWKYVASNGSTWNWCLPYVKTMADWCMRVKPHLRNAYGASSTYVGDVIEGMERKDWDKKLLGVNPLTHKMMTWERRCELGAATDKHVQEYMDKFAVTFQSCCELELTKLCEACKGSGRKRKFQSMAKSPVCKRYTDEAKKIRRAHCTLAGHGQKGIPSGMAKYMPHCMLHAPQRFVPQAAKTMVALADECKDAILNDPQASMALAPTMTSKDKQKTVMVKGNHATHFLANATRYLAPSLTKESNLTQLLRMNSGMQTALVRNLVHSVRSTRSHSSETVAYLGQQGMRLTNLGLLMHGAAEIQPYVYALGAEVPLQVQEIHQLHERLGLPPLDTRTFNAQNSEHNGFVLKQLEQHMSNHLSVEPPEDLNAGDIEHYFEDQLYRILAHEVIVKDWKYRLGVRTSLRKQKHSLPLMQPDACTWCACPASSIEHKAFCEHPLFKPLLDAADSGVLGETLVQLLSDEAARAALTSAPIEKEVSAPRITRPDNTIALAAAQNKGGHGGGKKKNVALKRQRVGKKTQ
jgi:hypothetical protein